MHEFDTIHHNKTSTGIGKSRGNSNVSELQERGVPVLSPSLNLKDLTEKCQVFNAEQGEVPPQSCWLYCDIGAPLE